MKDNESKYENKNNQLQMLVKDLESTVAASADRINILQGKFKEDKLHESEKSHFMVNNLQTKTLQMEQGMKDMYNLLTKKEEELNSAAKAKEEVMSVTRDLQTQRDNLQVNERVQ